MDSKTYSNVDILLIVTDDDWKFRRAINNISFDIKLKYDVLLDVRVISVARWQYYAEIQSGYPKKEDKYIKQSGITPMCWLLRSSARI